MELKTDEVSSVSTALPVTLGITDSETDPLPSRGRDSMSFIQLFIHTFRMGCTAIIPVSHGFQRQTKQLINQGDYEILEMDRADLTSIIFGKSCVLPVSP